MHDFNRLLHVINLETLYIWGIKENPSSVRRLKEVKFSERELRIEFIKNALESGFIELSPNKEKEYQFTSGDRHYANFYLYPQTVADLLSSIVRFSNLETGEVQFFLPVETTDLVESVKNELNSLFTN